jgi:hypothetical protein
MELTLLPADSSLYSAGFYIYIFITESAKGQNHARR